jgi:protein phosphatase
LNPLSPRHRQQLKIGTAFGVTDVGTVRQSNEDNFLIDAALDMAIVADGMGGHAAGELASAGALNAVRQFLQKASARHLYGPHSGRQANADLDATTPVADSHDPDATFSDAGIMAVALLFDAIEFANQTLYQQNVAQHRPEGGMGTTLTGFCRPYANGELVLFHVGDTRLYCLRNGSLHQLTHDQTLYQQAVDAGLKEQLPPRNMLLQAVGPIAHVQPQIRTLPLHPNDLLMLCSDGLHGVVSHGEIERVMALTTEATLEQACNYLVELAKKNGGRDNITVLMVKCPAVMG